MKQIIDKDKYLSYNIQMDRNIHDTLNNTEILRMPKHKLATFGVTRVYYYFMSSISAEKTKVREGTVISQRPKIIAPEEYENIFEGFGKQTSKYAQAIFQLTGTDLRILEYRFKNDSEEVNTVNETFNVVLKKINNRIDKNEDKLSAIIKGTDSTWQLSIMKFIVDITVQSSSANITELEEKGMFSSGHLKDSNLRSRIETLFAEVSRDKSKVKELGKLLKGSGLFEEYEDRFFALL
jgi:hypothetical protein